jgi:hypothetical protein
MAGSQKYCTTIAQTISDDGSHYGQILRSCDLIPLEIFPLGIAACPKMKRPRRSVHRGQIVYQKFTIYPLMEAFLGQFDYDAYTPF